jgi:hypothetical protein
VPRYRAQSDAMNRDADAEKQTDKAGKAGAGGKGKLDATQDKTGAPPRSRSASSVGLGSVPLRDPWFSEPVGPQTSPWLSRPQTGMTGNLQPQFQSPYQPQSPFPQRPPRPTGFTSDDAPQTYPYGSQLRPIFNNPFGVPTTHSPGAYHTDFNP